MKTQIGKVGKTVLAYTYVERGRFTLIEKPMPRILDAQDAIVRVTLASICASDLHIRQGSAPRAVPGVTVGHEMVGVVEKTGPAVTKVRVGDRVAVNVETFCGECFFCQNGFVNNCTHPLGGWALGCRIDGGQAPYVRVPLANQGLNRIPASVSDAQALFVGDILATGYWAARISQIAAGDTVLVIGAGPTGLCALSCALLKSPARVIVCEKDAQRRAFAARWYPQALVCAPEEAEEFVCARAQRPRRRGCGARSGRRRGQFRSGVEMRPAQRHGNGGGHVRPAADFAAAGDVWQKPHLQNRRGGWVRLRRHSG